MNLIIIADIRRGKEKRAQGGQHIHTRLLLFVHRVVLCVKPCGNWEQESTPGESLISDNALTVYAETL